MSEFEKLPTETVAQIMSHLSDVSKLVKAYPQLLPVAHIKSVKQSVFTNWFSSLTPDERVKRVSMWLTEGTKYALDKVKLADTVGGINYNSMKFYRVLKPDVIKYLVEAQGRDYLSYLIKEDTIPFHPDIWGWILDDLKFNDNRVLIEALISILHDPNYWHREWWLKRITPRHLQKYYYDNIDIAKLIIKHVRMRPDDYLYTPAVMRLVIATFDLDLIESAHARGFIDLDEHSSLDVLRIFNREYHYPNDGSRLRNNLDAVRYIIRLMPRDPELFIYAIQNDQPEVAEIMMEEWGYGRAQLYDYLERERQEEPDFDEFYDVSELEEKLRKRFNIE